MPVWPFEHHVTCPSLWRRDGCHGCQRLQSSRDPNRTRRDFASSSKHHPLQGTHPFVASRRKPGVCTLQRGYKICTHAHAASATANLPSLPTATAIGRRSQFSPFHKNILQRGLCFSESLISMTYRILPFRDVEAMNLCLGQARSCHLECHPANRARADKKSPDVFCSSVPCPSPLGSIISILPLSFQFSLSTLAPVLFCFRPQPLFYGSLASSNVKLFFRYVFQHLDDVKAV